MTPEEYASRVYPQPIRPLSEKPDADCLRGIADQIRAAVAEEREACAALALEVFEEGAFYENVKSGGSQIADAIRARGRPS